MTDIDVERFGEEVFQEFETLKATKIKFPPEEMTAGSPRSFGGCLFIPFLRILTPFVEGAIEQERRKRKHFENERYAKSLLARKDVRVIICGGFENLSKKDIVTERKFVQTVTNSLIEGISQEKFTIPFQPVLFAAVAYQISETGIEKFCQNTPDE